ncbi:MAG: cohesin domain-containing protein [Candidatus Auribacterota bacterium]
MKKINLLLFFLLLIAFRADAQTTPSLIAQDTIVDYGQVSVDVPVLFQTDGTVSALQFDVVYDQTVITAGDVELDDSIGGHTVKSNEVSPGRHRVVIYSGQNDVIAASLGVTIPFSVLQNAAHTSIEITNIVLSDVSASSVVPASVQNGSVTISSDDTDNDGMSDAWENGYFSCLCTADGASDYDNDGFIDLFEFRANTDPTDPLSLLEVCALCTDDMPGDKRCVVVTWTTAPDRTYTLYWRDNVDSTDWDEVNYTDMADDITDHGNGTSSWPDEGKDPQMGGSAPSDTGSRLYKVVVDIVQ